jgi:hypothetical protein
MLRTPRDNGRLWKRSISFTGLYKENLRLLARESSANIFIEPELVTHIFFCYV